MRTVSAIVPAAGLSRRFGGPNKLLQPRGDGVVVGAVVQALLSCSIPIIVVTGRDADLVAKAVAPARAVFNPSFEEGLGGSIAVGVKSCEEGGYLIALGDMPDLRPAVIRALLAAFESVPDTAILAPVYEIEPDRAGHPVLFGPAYREDLIQLTGDEGARVILRTNRTHLILISVPGELGDIDEPR